MRVEDVLGPRGELKDLAPPPGAMRAVCTLSPDAVRAVSPSVSFSFAAFQLFPLISTYSSGLGSSTGTLGTVNQLHALSVVFIATPFTISPSRSG